MSTLETLAFWTPSPAELIIIMIIALLLFGKRLPEVARNLGKGVVEFKKGLKGVEDDIDQDSSYQTPRSGGQAPPYGGEAGSQSSGAQHTPGQAPQGRGGQSPPAGV